MKKLIFVMALAFLCLAGFSQTNVDLRGDSIRVYKNGGYAEFVLRNKTKDTTYGFLQNMGNGRTEFHTIAGGSGGGFANPMTLLGQLIFGGASGTPTATAAPNHAGMRPYWNGSVVIWTDTTASGGNPFADNIALIKNLADNSKTALFDASLITTATLRTYTLPNANGVIVLNDNTATLTNKTINASNNTISNIINANISNSAAIANSKLANSTISGVSLGNNLFNHTPGYGIGGGVYNGSSAQSFYTDTACTHCPVSKDYFAQHHAGLPDTLRFYPYGTTGVNIITSNLNADSLFHRLLKNSNNLGFYYNPDSSVSGTALLQSTYVGIGDGFGNLSGSNDFTYYPGSGGGYSRRTLKLGGTTANGGGLYIFQDNFEDFSFMINSAAFAPTGALPVGTVMIGGYEGNKTFTGTYNTGFGSAYLLSLTTGHDNTTFGYGNFVNLTTGAYNVGVGGSNLVGITKGRYNIHLGRSTFGSALLSGPLKDSSSNNILIGNDSSYYTATVHFNSTYIGNWIPASRWKDSTTNIGNRDQLIQFGDGGGNTAKMNSFTVKQGGSIFFNKDSTATGSGYCVYDTAQSKWINLGGGGSGSGATGPVFLTSGTVSSAANLSISLTSWYNLYSKIVVELQDFVPATNGSYLTVRVSTDGSSYDASGYSYMFRYQYNDATGGDAGGSSATGIAIAGTGTGISNTSTNGWSGTITLFAPGTSTGKVKVNFEGNYLNNAGTAAVIMGGGQRNTNQLTKGIQIIPNSGNISAGVYQVWGYK